MILTRVTMMLPNGERVISHLTYPDRRKLVQSVSMEGRWIELSSGNMYIDLTYLKEKIDENVK